MAWAKPSNQSSPATSQLSTCYWFNLFLPGDSKGPDKFDQNNLQKHAGVKMPRKRLTFQGAMQQGFQAETQSCNRQNWEEPQFTGWRKGTYFKYCTENPWPCCCEEVRAWSEPPQIQWNNLRPCGSSKWRKQQGLAAFFLCSATSKCKEAVTRYSQRFLILVFIPYMAAYI